MKVRLLFSSLVACLATLVKTTVLFRNGRVRTTYTLKALETDNATVA